MLFNIIMICMIPIVGLLVFFSYRQGIKDGRAIKEDKAIEPILEFPLLNKKIEHSEETHRLNTILNNINNYNGGPVGQKEVK